MKGRMRENLAHVSLNFHRLPSVPGFQNEPRAAQPLAKHLHEGLTGRHAAERAGAGVGRGPELAQPLLEIEKRLLPLLVDVARGDPRRVAGVDAGRNNEAWPSGQRVAQPVALSPATLAACAAALSAARRAA